MGCVIVHDGIVIGRGHNQTESLQDATAHDETPALPYTGFGSAFRYEFSDKVYQGSIATWESAQPRPEARKLQYSSITDGILHQHEAQEDAVTP